MSQVIAVVYLVGVGGVGGVGASQPDVQLMSFTNWQGMSLVYMIHGHNVQVCIK